MLGTWSALGSAVAAVPAGLFCVLTFLSGGSCKWQTEPVGQERQVGRQNLALKFAGETKQCREV